MKVLIIIFMFPVLTFAAQNVDILHAVLGLCQFMFKYFMDRKLLFLNWDIPQFYRKKYFVFADLVQTPETKWVSTPTYSKAKEPLSDPLYRGKPP